MPLFHRIRISWENRSLMGVEMNSGNPARMLLIVFWLTMGTEDTPWAVSWLITGPVAMITGRKKMVRKIPRPLILPLSIRAMIRENAMMIGSCRIRLTPKLANVTG